MLDLTEILDRLFVDAEAIVAAFGDTFTTYQFIRRIARAHQHCYIELLAACRPYEQPFERAHMHIEKRLEVVAERLGYMASEGTVDREQGFFGDETATTVYRRRAE